MSIFHDDMVSKHANVLKSLNSGFNIIATIRSWTEKTIKTSHKTGFRGSVFFRSDVGGVPEQLRGGVAGVMPPHRPDGRQQAGPGPLRWGWSGAGLRSVVSPWILFSSSRSIFFTVSGLVCCFLFGLSLTEGLNLTSLLVGQGVGQGFVVLGLILANLVVLGWSGDEVSRSKVVTHPAGSIPVLPSKEFPLLNAGSDSGVVGVNFLAVAVADGLGTGDGSYPSQPGSIPGSATKSDAPRVGCFENGSIREDGGPCIHGGRCFEPSPRTCSTCGSAPGGLLKGGY
jgi:hypothetical protein